MALRFPVLTRERVAELAALVGLSPDVEEQAVAFADLVAQEIKPKRAPQVDKKALEFLKGFGVGESVAIDWLTVRKARKAPATETAINGIAKEALKAGISLHQALEVCCEAGWQSFKAEWYAKRNPAVTQGAGSWANQLMGRDDERTITVSDRTANGTRVHSSDRGLRSVISQEQMGVLEAE